MEIIPAIDIKSGRCVRLYQGDYNKETVYSDDPTSVALRWWEEGAGRLHVVDLDGALGGEAVNLDVIEAITRAVGVPVQVGGAIRSLETANRLLDMGVDRVILGTAAIEDPGLVTEICRERGSGRVVVAVDALDGRVAVKGWTEGTSVGAMELVERMTELGVGRYLYTDISRDGTLTSPNFDAIEALVAYTRHPVLASGGISSVDQVAQLAAIGVEGAILGKALYAGVVDLGAAIKAAQ